ncbi:hypothetical protein KCP71_25595 [Salmonella enterica subsp. enterica]|nr:hypothetical protein KCP71_25595 [Salmonella enterica subsp. enterica]
MRLPPLPAARRRRNPRYLQVSVSSNGQPVDLRFCANPRTRSDAAIFSLRRGAHSATKPAPGAGAKAYTAPNQPSATLDAAHLRGKALPVQYAPRFAFVVSMTLAGAVIPTLLMLPSSCGRVSQPGEGSSFAGWSWNACAVKRTAFAISQ